MPTTTVAFAGGAAPTLAYGRKTKVRFSPSSTWAAGDDWTLQMTSTLLGDFTLGKGNLAGSNPTYCMKLRNRQYLAAGQYFLLSSVTDVTRWEEQDAGAAKISFVSQAGMQDDVRAISTMQGRLAVFGARTIQIWQVDADPNQMALLQILENVGVHAPLSVQNVGDYDIFYLDNDGIRSLRAKEVTLNSYVTDAGTAIDLTIRAALVNFDASASCAIVEPSTMQYWLYLNGNIYIFSNYPESKVVAWSTYKPTTEVAVTPVAGVYTTVVGGIYYWTKAGGGTSLTCGTTVLTASGGFVATATTATEVGSTGTLVRVDTTFTPEKFVLRNEQVYLRATDGKVYCYGGTDNNTYDHTRATIELPWLDLKEPSTVKQGMGVDVAMTGAWTIYASMNPRATSLTTVIDRGSTASPDMLSDSTFDIGHFNYSGNGTHIKLKAVSGIAATKAKLGKLSFMYNPANKK